jgi:uncharacterized protein YukE
MSDIIINNMIDENKRLHSQLLESYEIKIKTLKKQSDTFNEIIKLMNDKFNNETDELKNQISTLKLINSMSISYDEHTRIMRQQNDNFNKQLNPIMDELRDTNRHYRSLREVFKKEFKKEVINEMTDEDE